MAVMIFDDGHIWCTKKHNNIWYNLDSLSDGPKPIHFRSIFSRQGFGWIVVWNNTRLVSNERSFQSCSKAVEHLDTHVRNQELDTVIVSQTSKLRSRRSSKRHRMEEDVVFDNSFSVIETNQSRPSNRFKVLSTTEH